MAKIKSFEVTEVKNWNDYLKENSRITVLSSIISLIVGIFTAIVAALIWAPNYLSLIILFIAPICANWVIAIHRLWQYQKVQLPLGLDHLRSSEDQEGTKSDDK